MSEQQQYLEGRIAGFWRYRETLSLGDGCPSCSAQRDPQRPLRPPVFCKNHRDRNVILDPSASPAAKARQG